MADLSALAVASIGGPLAASAGRASGLVVLGLGTAASAVTGGTLVWRNVSMFSMDETCGDELTARAPSSGGLVLGGRLLASALESRLLAAGALGLLCANASAVTAAAGDGNSTSGRRHCD